MQKSGQNWPRDYSQHTPLGTRKLADGPVREYWRAAYLTVSTHVSSAPFAKLFWGQKLPGTSRSPYSPNAQATYYLCRGTCKLAPPIPIFLQASVNLWVEPACPILNTTENPKTEKYAKRSVPLKGQWMRFVAILGSVCFRLFWRSQSAHGCSPHWLAGQWVPLFRFE